MAVAVVTPASTYPVTLAEARAHCRVDSTDEDSLIDGLIATATDHVERYTGRSLMDQTLAFYSDDFSDEMLLPRGPVQSVSSVKYYDADGVEQTLATSVYQVDIVSDPPRVLLADGQSWPTVDDRANAVTITYVAGYEALPAAIKHAILLLIGQWHDQRSAVTSSPMIAAPHAVDALLANYRAFA